MLDPLAGENILDSGEIRLAYYKNAADRVQPWSSPFNVGGIEVNGDQPAAGLDASKQLARVSAKSKSAIDDGLPRARLQSGEDAVEEHWSVMKWFGHCRRRRKSNP